MSAQQSPVISKVELDRYSSNDLVFMMGEELKRPLTMIKSLAEISAHDSIGIEARKALRTIDNVLLYQRVLSSQLRLHFEPVHLGSTITEVAAALQPLSLEFGCETEVLVQTGISPVDGDRTILTAGIESLWQAVLGLTKNPAPVVWQVRRKGNSVRLLVSCTAVDTTNLRIRKKNSDSTSRQPYVGFAGPATDLITAQGLFECLGARVSKYQADGRAGFAVTLRPNPQLALI